MKKAKVVGPDYDELRRILQNDLGRKVSKAEAKRIGEWVLSFYSHLFRQK